MSRSRSSAAGRAATPPGRENTTITSIPGDLCAFWFTVEGLDEIAAASQDLWLNGVAGERLTFARA